MQTRSRNNPILSVIIAAALFAVPRTEADDTTWLLKMSGEILGTVGGKITKLNTDNATFTRGFIGARFLIEVTDDTVLISVADSGGNAARTIFEFDTVTRIPLNAKSERIFAVGSGVDDVPHARLGSFSFDDATLFGTIQLDATTGAPKSISATIQASGTSDEGDILFDAKVKGKTVFVPQ